MIIKQVELPSSGPGPFQVHFQSIQSYSKTNVLNLELTLNLNHYCITFYYVPLILTFRMTLRMIFNMGVCKEGFEGYFKGTSNGIFIILFYHLHKINKKYNEYIKPH